MNLEIGYNDNDSMDLKQPGENTASLKEYTTISVTCNSVTVA